MSELRVDFNRPVPVGHELEYMVEAVQKHGAVRGLGLGLRRVLRCHPFTPGGIDPVP